jgi:hypothetical protein
LALHYRLVTTAFGHPTHKQTPKETPTITLYISTLLK